MSNVKHGRCRRGIRPPLEARGRPGVDPDQHHRALWRAVARGVLTECAAIEAQVSSAVRVRWFRQSGGVPNIELSELTDRFLNFSEREEIALLRAQGERVRAIVKQLGRSASTISRELRRNAATRSGYVDYRASTAR